jgi:hypothetical protein
MGVSSSLIGTGVSATIVYMAAGAAPVWLYALGCTAAIAGTVLGIVWEVKAAQRRAAERLGLR